MCGSTVQTGLRKTPPATQPLTTINQIPLTSVTLRQRSPEPLKPAPIRICYDTLASPQICHSSLTYIPPPRSSPHAHDATFTSYVDYAQGGSYALEPIRAPRPSGAAPSNVSHLPYGAPIPPPSASYPGHIHTPDEKRCEWDGCNQPLGENSCAGVRRHLRDHHFRGNPPSAKDLVQCKWAGCRREAMQWENIPKHVAECHTKSMTRTCSSCGDSFARSDTLKRHKEAGNCSGSSFH
ncbi:hypothetical protein TRAPUB_7790 [Trametes pubescens]|uniref:C2H2-type domain-containing protein n=1 Tax=Trametes pubescens TaxID=154538 RepID=A0A1M2V2C8_TRAPU|nr:hypothetical protein TRAPUB_7790 [Trametes pubescens]